MDQVNKAYSIQLDSPDGKMWVHISEDENERPVQVLINIGKTGASLYAWATATAELVSELLKTAGVHRAIEILSGHTSDRERRTMAGIQIRSGPEAIAVALIKYRHAKFTEATPERRRDGQASADIRD